MGQLNSSAFLYLIQFNRMEIEWIWNQIWMEIDSQYMNIKWRPSEVKHFTSLFKALRMQSEWINALP